MWEWKMGITERDTSDAICFIGSVIARSHVWRSVAAVAENRKTK